MRRLAQFVRLFTSRVPNACVCLCLSASRVCLRLCASRVCLRLSASVSSRLSRVCSRQGFRMRASVHVKGSECVRLLVSARVCVCVRQGFQMRAPVRQGFRMRASVCVCVRLSVCVCVCLLASASVHVKGSECMRLSRVCLASVSRRSSCLASVSRLSVLVNACGNWLILCVGRHSKSSKGFFFAIYPLAVFCERVLFFDFKIKK